MQARSSSRRTRAALRVVLSHYVLNGLSAALGLLLISAGVHLAAGPFAASVASVGVIVCIAPDQAAPRRGKFWHVLPAALFGLPLFMAVQALHARPLLLGLLLVPATFLAFLAGAWGRRGLPIVVSIMFAMVFSMAIPRDRAGGELWATGAYFALGALLYLLWSTLANAALNGRYRRLVLVDTLLALVELVRTQAGQFVPAGAQRDADKPLIGQLMQRQAALADQLQAARDILLESPRTRRRQQLSAMLIRVLEMRDHLLACELDLETLQARPGGAPALAVFRGVLEQLADRIEDLADALLLHRVPAVAVDLRPALAAVAAVADAPADALGTREPTPAALTGSLAGRIGHINDEVLALVGLARGDAAPDLAVVRTAWQMFVSPTTWSWQPLVAVWRWDAPPLRHAIRAALAIGAGDALSFVLPWGTHDYWILLTIVVVLRGSLAQTLERRNSRVAGTVLGCLLAGTLLWGHAPPWLLMLVVTLAQAVAHAFAARKYLVTAVAATILGLLQAHLLGGSRPAFDVFERLADTLIGAAVAWLFSYVLPSWERGQIPALVKRTLAAQARHARVALGLGQLEAVDNEPELEWRLARREAYDSLSALVQATQRSLSEPRAVRPPLEPLARLLAHSYQLQAQLTAVKTLLLLRRGQLDAVQIRVPLLQAASTVESTLLGPPKGGAIEAMPDSDREDPPPRFGRPEGDLSPWALRRLDLARRLSVRLRQDADEVVRALNPSPA